MLNGKINKIFIVVLFLANIYVWHMIFEFYFLKPSVNFLNVFQGDSALIINRSGNFLIDAGRRNYVLGPLSLMLPFFERTIDVAFVTHPDSDHFEGLNYILENYKVRVVVLNDFWNDGKSYQKMLSSIANKNVKVVLGVKGLMIKADSFDGEILYPKFEEIFTNKTNEKSQVMLINALEKKWLFTGDITSKIFDGILDDVGDFSVDVLKTPHHGGKNTINDRVLSVINPKEVVISVGDNSYGHPSLETLDLLEKFKIKISRTDILGNIVFQ